MEQKLDLGIMKNPDQPPELVKLVKSDGETIARYTNVHKPGFLVFGKGPSNATKKNKRLQHEKNLQRQKKKKKKRNGKKRRNSTRGRSTK